MSINQFSVSNNFSKKLDDEPVFDNITFEKSFSESIRLASEETIPKSTGSSKITPWINDDLWLLHDERRLCKEPNRLLELNVSIRKLRNKLKNDYFSDLTSNINFASEARAVKEEFRFCKEYRINKPLKKMVMSNEKLLNYNQKSLILIISPIFYHHIR